MKMVLRKLLRIVDKNYTLKFLNDENFFVYEITSKTVWIKNFSME